MKVALFQVRGRGHGHPENYATPILFPDSMNSIYKLSIDISFVSELFDEVVEKAKIEKHSIWGAISGEPSCLSHKCIP